MNFYRRNWYFFGGALFVLLSFIMGFWGRHISLIQLLLVYSFMALLVHQFEEYGVPGGFPSIFNIVMNGETRAPDRYPQNSNLAMIVNVPLAYTFYASAIFLPDVIWLGLATMFFGLFQIFFHGVVINIRLKSRYNPGLGACIFLHAPLGIYYIWYVAVNDLASLWDYIGGLIGTFAAAALIIIIPVRKFAGRDTKYPFSQEEMDRFNMKEKVEKLDISGSIKLFQR